VTGPRPAGRSRPTEQPLSLRAVRLQRLSKRPAPLLATSGSAALNGGAPASLTTQCSAMSQSTLLRSFRRSTLIRPRPGFCFGRFACWNRASAGRGRLLLRGRWERLAGRCQHALPAAHKQRSRRRAGGLSLPRAGSPVHLCNAQTRRPRPHRLEITETVALARQLSQRIDDQDRWSCAKAQPKHCTTAFTGEEAVHRAPCRTPPARPRRQPCRRLHDCRSSIWMRKRRPPRRARGARTPRPVPRLPRGDFRAREGIAGCGRREVAAGSLSRAC
jgi:hypothetical protein